MRLGTLIALALWFIGCAHNASVTRYSQTQYPPTTSEIDVYSTAAPSRPYTEIAKLEVDDRHGSPITALVKKAKEIGAQGLILTGQREGKRVMAPLGGMLIGRTLTMSTGVAIRYTEAKAEAQ